MGPRSDRPKRRVFTAEYKAGILAEYDAADRGAARRDPAPGGPVLLPHRGVARAAEAGALAGLAPAAKDRRDREIEALRARAEKAEAELARTRAALDLVGKAHAYAGDRACQVPVGSSRWMIPSKMSCRAVWPLHAASSRWRCRTGRNSGVVRKYVQLSQIVSNRQSSCAGRAQ